MAGSLAREVGCIRLPASFVSTRRALRPKVYGWSWFSPNSWLLFSCPPLNEVYANRGAARANGESLGPGAGPRDPGAAGLPTRKHGPALSPDDVRRTDADAACASMHALLREVHAHNSALGLATPDSSVHTHGLPLMHWALLLRAPGLCARPPARLS